MCFVKTKDPSADESFGLCGYFQLAPDCHLGEDFTPGCMILRIYDLFLLADQRFATSPMKPPAAVMIAIVRSSLSPGLILYSAAAAAESSNPRSSNSIKSEKLLAQIVTSTASPTYRAVKLHCLSPLISIPSSLVRIALVGSH